MATQVENNRGEYVPAIPVPYFRTVFGVMRYFCGCKAKFDSIAAYRGHYALVHILGLDPQ